MGNNVQKNGPKLAECGETFEEFDKVIRKEAIKLHQALDELRSELDSDQDFFEELYNRFATRQFPFKQDELSFPVHILVDGFYAVYLKHWLNFYQKENLLVIDGNELYTNPGDIMLQVQEFVGLETVIKKEHFLFNEERGMYCLNLTPELNTCSKLAETKGRTINRHLSNETSAALKNLFQPFDDYLAVLAEHEPFNWTYQNDS